MKAKSKLILLAISALAAVACTLGVDDTQTPDGRKRTTHFEAVTEGATATKVYADKEAMKVLWNAGDCMTIFNRSTSNSKYDFKGADGAERGSFDEDPGVSTSSGNQLASVYAVYPFYSNMTINNKGSVITTVLPAEQLYKANTFGIGANTMVAVSNNDFLAFKNLCGYLSLMLYGDDVSVSRITITGNNREKISGKTKIGVRLNELPVVYEMDESATESISLVCDPPVKLGATAAAPTDFWFVIPPTKFEHGFTVTVTDDSGKVFEKKTTKPLTVTRNTLDWMSPLEVVPTYDPAPMVVCTFNVRKADPDAEDVYPDGSSAGWEVRESAVKNFLDAVKPDLVGLQEIRKAQSKWFASYSNDYGYFDVSRDSEDGVSVYTHGGSHEGIGVLYRKDRFELVSRDFFWLDENPQKLPEKHQDAQGATTGYGSWNSGSPRITLSVVLKDKKHANTLVYFFPTHYDNKSKEARENSSRLMVSQMKSICNVDDLKEAEVVIFHVGDLNTPSDGGEIDCLNENLYYARTIAGGSDINTETLNRFGKSQGRGPIFDHIYYGGKSVKPVRYWVDRTDYGVPYISDHYPVLFQWEYYPPTNSE